MLHIDQLTVLLRNNGSFETAYAIGSALATPVRTLPQTRSSAAIFNSANDGRTPDKAMSSELARFVVPHSLAVAGKRDSTL